MVVNDNISSRVRVKLNSLLPTCLRVRGLVELCDVGDVGDDVGLDLQVVGDDGGLDDHSGVAARRGGLQGKVEGNKMTAEQVILHVQRARKEDRHHRRTSEEGGTL